MISIDNAVELMIKTYLGLPKRVTGLGVPRKEYQEISESFPSLLDALEKYAASKLEGIDLGTIEWYHRLRNQLYHQGNGLTVERDKVEVYAELANLLFRNLFGFDLVERVTPESDLLGEFIQAWVALERGLAANVARNSLLGISPRSVLDSARFMERAGLLTKAQVAEIDSLRKTRNEIIHGTVDHRAVLTPGLLSRLTWFVGLFPEDA